MKNLKKTFAVIIAVVMVLSMSVMAFATTSTQITVTNALQGATYNLYKIFDAVDAGTDPTTQAPHDTLLSNNYNIAYTIRQAEAPSWFDAVSNYKVGDANVFTLTATAADPEVYVVGVNSTDPDNAEATALYKTADDAAAFAAYLGEYAKENNMVPFDTKTTPEADGDAEDISASIQFNDLPLGYYFLTTTTGSLFALDTNNASVNIAEKNTYPNVDKEIVEDGEEKKANDVNIGDTVNYKITITDGVGTDKKITIHDKMTPGLTWNGDLTVTAAGAVTTDYTLSTDCEDGCTFKVEFSADFVKNLADNAAIVLEFSAKLNANAVIAPSTNDNEVELVYGDDYYKQTDKVETKTYEFDIVKTKYDGEFLTGAEFKLYKDEDCTQEVVLTLVDGVYRPVAADGEAVAASIAVNAQGQARIKGLDAGTYYLKETVAPTGYNALHDVIPVTLGGETGNGNIEFNNANNNNKWDNGEGGVQVVNYTGNELPATGGMGTKILTIVGIICMVSAAILLITKKKVVAMYA